MTGGDTSPHRRPCSGMRLCFPGSPYRHAIASVIVDKYCNKSEFTYYSDVCAGEYVDVGGTPLWYPKDPCGNNNYSTPLSCIDGYPSERTTADSTPIIDPDDSPLYLLGNTFIKDGTKEYAVCRHLGRKRIGAEKVWHGMYGFYHDATTGAHCDTGVLSNTKYRTLSALLGSSTHAQYVSDGTDLISGQTYNGSGQYTFTATVGEIYFYTIGANDTGGSCGSKSWTTSRAFIAGNTSIVLTGIPGAAVTATLCGKSVNSSSAWDGHIERSVARNTGNLTNDCDANYYYGGVLSDECAAIVAEAGVCNDKKHGYNNMTSEPRCLKDIAEFDSDVLCPSTFAQVIGLFVDYGEDAPDRTSLGGWTYEKTVNGDDITAPLYNYVNIVVTRTDAKYEWDAYYITETSVTVDEWDISGHIELKDLYTLNEVLADAVAAADEWEMDDDITHQWRSDVHLFVAPFVSYDENPLPQSPIGFICGDDAIASDYAGSIVGEPLPAGYGETSDTYIDRGIWDFYSDVWYNQNCGLGSYQQGAKLRGEYTPTYLPSNATQWTRGKDLAEGQRIFTCPTIYADTRGIYLVKEVQTMIARPSYNFAAPYGELRFALDETKTYTFDSQAGNDVTLVDYAGSPATVTIVAGDYAGGSCVGGFYAVTAVVADVVTLGTKLYDMPTGWTTPSGDEATAFGKLRFYKTTAPKCLPPGFGGRLAVTAVYGAVTTLTYSSSPYIVTGDKIDYQKADGTWMDNGGAGYAITRIGDTSCTIAGDHSAAKYIVPHKLFDDTTSGQKWYMDDSRPKGDYVVRKWTWSIADGEATSYTETQKCLPWVNCAPSVIGASPNGETFTNGTVEAFPTTIGNGEIWACECEQWMIDPLWQDLHRPSGSITWEIDSGDCTGDYPMMPFVESRFAPPATYGASENETAPAVTALADYDITAEKPFPSYATFVSNEEGEIKSIMNNPAMPWTIYALQKGCVDGSGTFATDYENNLTFKY